MSGKSLATAAMITLGGLSLGGCATTDYVDEQIALVNGRIDGVQANLAQTDAKATAATTQAQTAAADAQNANRKVDALTGRVSTLEQQRAAPPPRQPRN